MYTLHQDRRIRIVLVAIAIVMVFLIVLYSLSNVLGPDAIAWIVTPLTILSAASCAGLSGMLWYHFHRGEILKKIWGCLWIGLLLWTAGELVYGVQELTFGETPYPSWADLLFAPGLIPIFVALILRYTSLRVTPPRKLVRISGAAFGMVGALWLMFVLGPIVESPGSGSVTMEILNIYYPLGDLMIVMGALLSMLALAGGELSLPWGAIALSCLVLAFSDSLYSYANWKDIYALEDSINLVTALCDITYIAGYLIMAFGLYVQARLQRIL
jgi:hypothetical protein